MSSTLIVEPCLMNNTEHCNTVTPTSEFESCTTNSKQIWLSHYYNYTLRFNPRPRQFWISLHKVFDTKDWWTNSRWFYERSLHSCAPCVTNCGFRNRLSVCRCLGPPCTPTLHLQLCSYSWVTSFHASVLYTRAPPTCKAGRRGRYMRDGGSVSRAPSRSCAVKVQGSFWSSLVPRSPRACEKEGLVFWATSRYMGRGSFLIWELESDSRTRNYMCMM